MNNHRNFETVWREIQHDINAGDTIRNWTQHSEYIGGEFTIRAIGAGFIEIDSPRAKNFQRVSKEDFAAVYEIWDDYNAGRVPRNQVRDLTRYSKYIISILRHVTRAC